MFYDGEVGEYPYALYKEKAPQLSQGVMTDGAQRSTFFTLPSL